MSEWKLPRLISNGMVLQQKKRVRIWGFDKPGRKVMVAFLGRNMLPLPIGKGYGKYGCRKRRRAVLMRWIFGMMPETRRS